MSEPVKPMFTMWIAPIPEPIRSAVVEGYSLVDTAFRAGRDTTKRSK